MQTMALTSNIARTALAFEAVVAAVLICFHQQHFTLSLADPYSFYVMTTHRCGDVLLASVLWCAFEVSRLAIKARA
jgi:predicted nucleic acid-binding protein